MKKLLILLMAALVFSAADSWARPDAADTDLVALGNYYMPEDDDLWDDGWGGELQARFWLSPSIGLAVAGGYAQWDLDGDRFSVSGGFLDSELDGEIDMVPVGGSLLFRPFGTDYISLMIEGGVRYVFIDSDVDVRIAGTKYRVDVDDAVIALAIATLELDLSEDVFLFIGGGYQWDIDDADADFLDEDLDDVELEGAIAQAGIGLRF